MKRRALFTALAGMIAVLVAGGMTTTAQAATTAAPANEVQALQPCGYDGGHPTISQGDQGSVVAHAQCLLRNVWGYGISVDGIFGPVTSGTVSAHQRDCNIAVDGIVGPQTWNALHPDTAPGACG